MVTYLVMKNNLKRTFLTRFTYIVMLFIPIVISFVSIVAGSFSDSDIRVGVIGDAAEYKEISDAFDAYPMIHYERAKEASKHTDLITGKYQYLIDLTGKSNDAVTDHAKASLSAIVAAAEQGQKSRAEGLTQTERTLALLFTAYLIIASVYATTMIRDKKNGTMERFCFAGFHKNAYCLGYIASTTLVMLCQLSLAVIILTVFDQNFSISVAGAVEQVLFMAAVASIFGVGVASFLKSELSANITASSIVVILSLLGGTFVSVEQMPRFLQCVSVISPIRWLQFLS